MSKGNVSLLAILLLAIAPTAFAQEACGTRWEYRIVDLSVEADKLIQRSSGRVQASSQLLAILNRLGGQGWDLASQHTISVSEEIDDPELRSAQVWVAEMRPSTALFKRQIPCR